MLFCQPFQTVHIPEYNVSAWMLYQVGNIRKIESVQATFTRLVCRKINIKYESYKHRLSFFNLVTLEIQRIKYDLVLILKIIHNLIDLQFDDFFSIIPSPYYINLEDINYNLIIPFHLLR